MNTLDIPLDCPSCNGRMYATSYDASLKILKDRSWQVCKDCGFEQLADDFKRKLWTV